MTCPLCALEFDEATCPPSCPMSNGCAMTRCPRCGYEFVEDGAIAALFRRWFGTPASPPSDPAPSRRRTGGHHAASSH